MMDLGEDWYQTTTKTFKINKIPYEDISKVKEPIGLVTNCPEDSLLLRHSVHSVKIGIVSACPTILTKTIFLTRKLKF